MPILVYQILHLVSVLLLVATTFSAFANTDPRVRKKTLMISGILSLLVLVGGMGLLAKNNLGWPGWVLVKLVCWLVLSALAGFAYRKPASVGALRALAVALLAIAVYMVYARPF